MKHHVTIAILCLSALAANEAKAQLGPACYDHIVHDAHVRDSIEVTWRHDHDVHDSIAKQEMLDRIHYHAVTLRSIVESHHWIVFDKYDGKYKPLPEMRAEFEHEVYACDSIDMGHFAYQTGLSFDSLIEHGPLMHDFYMKGDFYDIYLRPADIAIAMHEAEERAANAVKQ